MGDRAEELKSLQEEIKSVLAGGKSAVNAINEETTKMSFILRLFGILGYDIHNKNEVAMEVPVDSGRIDIVLRVNDKDLVIVECKALSEKLSDKSIKQLKRYYTDKKAHLAILTNGNDYWFFTDSERMNVMSKIPFSSIRISDSKDYTSLDKYDRDHIENMYVPSIGNKLVEEKNDLKIQVKLKDQELVDTHKKIQEIEKKLSLTEAQQRELTSLRNMALVLKCENEKLKSKLDYAERYDKQSKTYSKAKNLGLELKYGSKFDKFKVNTDVAKAMVAMMPESLFVPETTFFDPCCRHGEFLLAIMERLINTPAMRAAFKNEGQMIDHIRYNQLFAMMPDINGVEEVTRAIYGTAYPYKNNIIGFEVNEDGKNKYAMYQYARYIFNQIRHGYRDSLLIGEVESAILEKLGDMPSMNFDVVASNPPYNNDMYIDFVKEGVSIASKFSIYITPAKWQDKGGKDNIWFRENIVPHIKDIVFYPDATELFDIAEIDGVCFYSVDSATYEEKRIINICGKNTQFNTERVRPICGVLNNQVYEILQKMKGKKLVVNTKNDHFKLGRISDGTIDVYSAGKVVDHCNIRDIHQNVDDIDKYKVVSNEMLGYSFFFDDNGKMIGSPEYKVLGKNTVCSSHYVVYRAFDNEDEAESLVSYLNTKLIRFITALALTGTTTSKNEFWRFVPDPGNLDHIFTDDEMYKKYKLTAKEIEVIESVIKERK